MNRAQEVETTEKNMITEKVDAVRDRVKRARDNLRVKVHINTLLSRMLLILLRDPATELGCIRKVIFRQASNENEGWFSP